MGIDFNKEGIPYRLPANKEIILFRICQEALNNIIKHAGAQNIGVQIVYSPDMFVVRIKDDGGGFDMNSVPHRLDSSGLYSMHNRAVTLNAELIVDSVPGQGTSILINLPIN